MQFEIYSKTKKDNREINKQVRCEPDDYALLIVGRAVLVINLNSFS